MSPAVAEAVAPSPETIGDLLADGPPNPAARAETLLAQLRRLQSAGLDATPLPGGGLTLDRWRVLTAVARWSLPLVKLVEGHLDAIAILAELGRPELHTPEKAWAVWASEPPDAQVAASPRHGDALLLRGRKAWCSGATVLSHGLLTVRGPAGEKWLAAIDLAGPGIRMDDSGWAGLGMRAAATSTVDLDGAAATRVGGDGAYLDRPGFWHGGAGIAACWYGGTGAVGALLAAGRRADQHGAAHLGAIDARLAGVASLLRATAARIDRDPLDPAAREVQQVRAGAAECAEEVLARVARATGPGPLATDAEHAQRVSDLTVFIRQWHAERDLQGLGEACDPGDWAL